MKNFVIFVTLVACIYAAPTVELLHPSPINPQVLVAIKPEEKIILITDPQEIAKFKRETKEPFYPTVLPEDHEHHITKWNHNLTQQKRDIPVPLVAKHYHPEESPTTKKENSEYPTVKDQTQDHANTDGFQKPQTLPLRLNSTAHGIQQHKRDIPVPLVPKHRHPEESLIKDNNENVEIHHEPHNTGHEEKDYFKSSQEKPQVLSTILKETKDFEQYRKREEPTSLVSKQESSEDNEAHKYNKEVEAENNHVSLIQHVPQSLPSDNHKDITTEGFHKPENHNDDIKPNNKQYHDPQTNPDQNSKHSPVDGSQGHYKENISIRKSQAPTTHQDDDQNISVDEKKELKKCTNADSSQYTVEKDISGSKHSQVDVSHNLPTQKYHKPNIQEDHLSDHDIRLSSTEHPLVRHRPVPVAELFGK